MKRLTPENLVDIVLAIHTENFDGPPPSREHMLEDLKDGQGLIETFRAIEEAVIRNAIEFFEVGMQDLDQDAFSAVSTRANVLKATLKN